MPIHSDSETLLIGEISLSACIGRGVGAARSMAMSEAGIRLIHGCLVPLLAQGFAGKAVTSVL